MEYTITGHQKILHWKDLLLVVSGASVCFTFVTVSSVVTTASGVVVATTVLDVVTAGFPGPIGSVAFSATVVSLTVVVVAKLKMKE